MLAWTLANFCSDFIGPNLSIARSRCRNDRWLFSTRLLFEILPGYALADDLRAAVENVCGLRPNIDFTLAVLTRRGHLPEDASVRLFALGRSIGWVAHAVEQFGDDKLIRSRAQYTGVLPEYRERLRSGR